MLSLSWAKVMGQSWSEAVNNEEERVKKAVEALDAVAWDCKEPLSYDLVSKIIHKNSVCTHDCIFRIKSSIKNSEAEQVRKEKFFKEKSMHEFEYFHRYKASRYGVIVRYLDIFSSNN